MKDAILMSNGVSFIKDDSMRDMHIEWTIGTEGNGLITTTHNTGAMKDRVAKIMGLAMGIYITVKCNSDTRYDVTDAFADIMMPTGPRKTAQFQIETLGQWMEYEDQEDK